MKEPTIANTLHLPNGAMQIDVYKRQNTYYLTQNGGLSNTILDGAMLVVSKADIVDTFNNICNLSLIHI